MNKAKISQRQLGEHSMVWNSQILQIMTNNMTNLLFIMKILNSVKRNFINLINKDLLILQDLLVLNICMMQIVFFRNKIIRLCLQIKILMSLEFIILNRCINSSAWTFQYITKQNLESHWQ